MASRKEIVDLTDSPEQKPSFQSDPVLPNNADEEDEDLKRAIALSLQDQGMMASSLPNNTDDGDNGKESLEPAVKAVSAIAGLDRKQMEADRLARLKRKREQEDTGRAVSPPSLRRHVELGNKQNQIRPMSTTRIIETKSNSDVSSSSFSTAASTMEYPDGVILQTHAEGYDNSRSITFESLIDAKNLKSCLLSSFIWDFDWLFPHFATKTTRFVLVMQGKDAYHREQISSDFASIPNVRLCFPPMDGIVNCMHSKLMLLFYTDRCRIVVPTANLVGFDWGVGSVMENTLWMIDLPARNLNTARIETTFKGRLVEFLQAQQVPSDVVAKLDVFDFAKTAMFGFVHSIGGTHREEGWKNTGLCGLGRTVTELGLASEDPIEIDFVTSSIGNLNEEFMRSIYFAAQGDNGLLEYGLRNSKPSSSKPLGFSLKSLPSSRKSEWKSNFRVFFPSDETVQASNGGPGAAGTICFQERWWSNGKFPTQCLRDNISVRPGLLMHNKIIFVRLADAVTTREENTCIGWVYVGSGNLSESAWGRLVQDKGSKQPKLNCRNWECGVVVPINISRKEVQKGSSGEKETALDNFVGTIPVPIRCPGTSYSSSSMKPWFFGG